MTIAQCKAARHRNRQYRRKGVIGQPYYKVASVEKQERREIIRREKAKAAQGRKRK